jgi:CBS domain containing-hemolysin-like protein
MITDKLARVPAPGATLSTEGASFVVRESDEKHITKVEVQPCGAPLGEASIAEGDRQVG